MAEVKTSYEFREEDFREIEIEDQSSQHHASILYIPQSLPSFNNNLHSIESPPRISQQISTPMIIPISERDIKFKQCVRYAKWIKIMSVLEALFTFIFLIAPGDLKFLMFLVIVPIIGYLAGRYYKIWLTISYMIYLFLLAIIRIILMIIIYDTLFTTLEILVIVVDIIVTRILWKFITTLRIMTDIERRDLRILQNGVKKSNHHIDQFGPASLKV